MKNITKALMVCGLVLGGLFMAAPSFAQNEADAPQTEKVTATSTDAAAPAATAEKSEKHECKPGCTMACCAGKAKAMGGNVESTSADAGAKKPCTHKKTSCTGKKKGMSGEMSSTDANHGSSTAKKSCTHKKTSCTGKKKAMSGEMSSTDANHGSSATKKSCAGKKKACCKSKKKAEGGASSMN